MKQSVKTILVVITSVVSSSLVNKQTIKVMTSKVLDMQALNNVRRVESWDHIEKLISKGCNKEALQFIKIKQSEVLSDIKYQIGNNHKRIKVIEKRNHNIAKRAETSVKLNGYSVPTCE